MARHRNIRNAHHDGGRFRNQIQSRPNRSWSWFCSSKFGLSPNLDDELDDYGRSYEEEYGVSPTTASQFMYRRDDPSRSVNPPATVDEECYEDEELPQDVAVDEGKMRSCADYIESCSGEAFSRDQVRRAVLAANYNAELALQLLLDNEGNVHLVGGLPPVFAAKPPLPALTRKLETLAVAEEAVMSQKNSLARDPEGQRPSKMPRTVDLAEDPSVTLGNSKVSSKLGAVQLPPWISNFLNSVNQYNAEAAHCLTKYADTRTSQANGHPFKEAPGIAVSKERPFSLGIPRPESTPDFRSLGFDRSTATTPTPGSPKSIRRGSRDTPSGITPAGTPTPGSPKSQRKSGKEKFPQRLSGKGDEAPGDGGSASKPAEAAAPARSSAKVAALYEQRQASSKPLINLIVIGHVDAGKSTLMGHMLFLVGKVDAKQMTKFEHEAKKSGKSSFMYAWVLDETGEERQRGVTVDIAHTSFETPNRSVNLMDAPGHKDFIPNMITGAAQADVAVLVVDSTRGEFETGFESGGQTREHTLLARSLGVTQIVVAVNKMDNEDWSQERFDFIVATLGKFLKGTGFKDADVSFVPCSGFTGDNLTLRPTNVPSASWWTGPTLLHQMDQFRPPTRQIDKPYRQVITDVFKSAAGGFCVAGRIEAGHIQVGDKLTVMPASTAGTVKGIMLDSGSSNTGFAGDQVMVTIAGVDMVNVHVGDVLCDSSSPVHVATRIRARIAVFVPKVPLLAGQECVFHNQSFTESCVIKKLLTQINRNTGEVQKKNPRALTKNTSGEVEILLQRPVCAELYSASKELGRFMLRDSGATVAAGVITEILG